MLYGIVQIRLDSYVLLLLFTFSHIETRNSILNWACFERCQNACLRCLISVEGLLSLVQFLWSQSENFVTLILLFSLQLKSSNFGSKFGRIFFHLKNKNKTREEQSLFPLKQLLVFISKESEMINNFFVDGLKSKLAGLKLLSFWASLDRSTLIAWMRAIVSSRINPGLRLGLMLKL